MKTPREILLERHRAAEEKLSGISAKELASLATANDSHSHATLASIFRSAINGFWQQAFLPWRKTWAGLAAVWIGIAIINHAPSESSQPAKTESAAIRNPQVLSALREQNKMLVQLLEPFTAPAPENLNPNHSGPRSERRIEMFIA